jgi:hypothetical protein
MHHGEGACGHRAIPPCWGINLQDVTVRKDHKDRKILTEADEANEGFVEC